MKERFINAKGGLNMRNKPDAGGDKVALIPDGEKVELLEESGGDITISGSTGKWSRVKWNDKSGWVFGGFLKGGNTEDNKDSGRFTDNGDGTVKDKNTTLLWQKCSAGQSGKDCSTGEASKLSWEDALAYCKGLSLGGKTDWRIPNFLAFEYLVDKDKKNPAINMVVFPRTKSSNYWMFVNASQPGSKESASFNFAEGTSSESNKSDTNYLRCSAVQ